MTNQISVVFIWYLMFMAGCTSMRTSSTDAEKAIDITSKTSWVIYEVNTSDNKFIFGAYIKNLGDIPYTFIRRHAQVYFTSFADWRDTRKFSPQERKKLSFATDVQVTSWEDGDNPALKLVPGEEKWIRVEGTLDGPKAKQFLQGNMTHASIALTRWVDPLWGATASKPFVLYYTLKQNIERYCKRSTECQ